MYPKKFLFSACRPFQHSVNDVLHHLRHKHMSLFVGVYAVGAKQIHIFSVQQKRRSQVDETTVVFKRAFDDCKIVALVIAADVRKVSVQKLHHLGAVGDRAKDV